MNDPKQGPSTNDRDDLEREVESLRKRIHRLQLEHDILKGANELLKKDQGIDPQNLTNREKTLLVDALRTTYKVSELLEQVEMPRSSYFYHRKRLEQPEKYAELRRTVTEIFHANKRCYGYRRVHWEVKRCGFSISEIIRRVMAEEGLVVVTTRRRWYSAYNGEIWVFPELVNTKLSTIVEGVTFPGKLDTRTVIMAGIRHTGSRGVPMRKSAYTDAQIAYALKQAETGTPVSEVCRKMGISENTYYRWKKKYVGVLPSELKRIRQLEEENRQLKKLVADLSLDKHMLQEVLSKKA